MSQLEFIKFSSRLFALVEYNAIEKGFLKKNTILLEMILFMWAIFFFINNIIIILSYVRLGKVEAYIVARIRVKKEYLLVWGELFKYSIVVWHSIC